MDRTHSKLGTGSRRDAESGRGIRDGEYLMRRQLSWHLPAGINCYPSIRKGISAALATRPVSDHWTRGPAAAGHLRRDRL